VDKPSRHEQRSELCRFDPARALNLPAFSQRLGQAGKSRDFARTKAPSAPARVKCYSRRRHVHHMTRQRRQQQRCRRVLQVQPFEIAWPWKMAKSLTRPIVAASVMTNDGICDIEAAIPEEPGAVREIDVLMRGEKSSSNPPDSSNTRFDMRQAAPHTPKTSTDSRANLDFSVLGVA
jgi:hypothetical protein